MVAQTLEAATWAVLSAIPDPEIPVISLVDLGIIRHVRSTGESVEIGVSPTYSGCPATEVIRQDIKSALAAAGMNSVSLVDVLSPQCRPQRGAARVSAVRFNRYGAHQRVRVDAMQSPAPLQRLPRAIRTLQVHLI